MGSLGDVGVSPDSPHAVDPAHWLYRLRADEWARAAENELTLCLEALNRRAVRPGVTHARRAAGMAWNGLLVVAFDERFGRSYMEHVSALASDERAPLAIREAAQHLAQAPTTPPALLQIGKPDLSAHVAASLIVEYAQNQVMARSTDIKEI